MLESSEKLNNQAIVLAQNGEYKEAIACFKRAISIERQNYLLWFNLGLTYRDAGNLEDARTALEKAEEINPDDELVLETLAALCYSMGDDGEAMYYCMLCLDVNICNSHIWNTLGVVYFNRKDYGNACEAFEQAVSIDPYYYDALFNLHDTYEELGNEAGTAECARRMSEIERR